MLIPQPGPLVIPQPFDQPRFAGVMKGKLITLSRVLRLLKQFRPTCKKSKNVKPGLNSEYDPVRKLICTNRGRTLDGKGGHIWMRHLKSIGPETLKFLLTVWIC